MKEIQKWIMVRKARIPIFEGQDKSQALKNKFKIKKKISKKLDLKIDYWTNCLKNTLTGEEIDAEVIQLKITPEILKRLKREKWIFNWGKDKGKEKYAIRIKGNNKLEGLISLDKEDGYIYVNLVESNPANRGKSKKYYGVGPYLFAIACKRSFEEGFDGYVCFCAKTNLVGHYKKTLNAQSVGNQRMIINTKNAKILIDKYFKGGPKNA